MLVMAAALILGCTGGLAAGGSLSRLAGARVRAWPILVAAAVIEACLGATSNPLRTVLAVTACLGVVGWCAASRAPGRRFPYGQALISAGVALNAIVMALNGGMPVSRLALIAAPDRGWLPQDDERCTRSLLQAHRHDRPHAAEAARGRHPLPPGAYGLEPRRPLDVDGHRRGQLDRYWPIWPVERGSRRLEARNEVAASRTGPCSSAGRLARWIYLAISVTWLRPWSHLNRG
jgi:hypothetical protein